MTRIIWSRRELEREDASNDATLCLGSPTDVAASPTLDASFEQLFHGHYPAIRRLLDGRTDPGLALLAASPSSVEASGWFAAKQAIVNPLIVGRHTSADVLLPADPRVPLRHLALVLHRKRDERAVAFRVLDLRTPLAFADEAGSPLEAVEARGPVFLRCGPLGLLLFPTGGSTPSWPEDAEAAWSRIPERRYVEKTPTNPDRGPAAGGGPRPLSAADPDPGRTTLVNAFAGPVFPSLELDASDPPRGELVIRSASGSVALRLGARAARRGVLLGRYDRCDTTGFPVLIDPAVSRVHLLVLELDGALYAIDTASKNGSWNGEERVRAIRILPGLAVSLAGKATVEWHPFH